ncbi:sensor histidine kinase [Caulobacter sp. LjRoot300]|uniref:sensor histidine kinase n=1 Tax=Caulobacter sp. LjRoot300 TaxID=3342321 RepID=UPI003ED0E1DA
MKPRGSSLAWRLVVWFVAVAAVASVLATAMSLLFWRQAGDEYAFAQMNLERVAVGALREDPDGGVRLADTGALSRFRQARPRAQVAVIWRGRVLEGSSPMLAQALTRLKGIGFLDASFVFGQGPLAGETAVATLVESRFGPVTVVGARNPMRPGDLPALALYMGGYLIRIVGLAALAAALVTPWVIGRALAPLKAASIQAAAIDVRRRDVRLPLNNTVPTEVAGLVRAINLALDRLDEGVSRQQRFAAEAAHELRTPLAILAARIDNLPPGDQVAGMRRDIERMPAMVDQLLMVARLEAGAARGEDLIDLVDLTRDVVADCSPLALAQHRRLALLPHCQTLLVRGDPRLLQSALRNLVENAIRAEPAGGRIDITVGPEPVVCVIDHGPGVPEEDRERVFEPFWRRRDGHPGAGLGLAIVREVARTHGGHVAVTVTPGGGATFRFSCAGP